jgi:hypothetical protein
MLTPEEAQKIQAYTMSRNGSKYDRAGIISFLFGKVSEDEFSDYCSELVKNSLHFAGKIEDVEKISPFSLYKLLRPQMHFR